MQCALQFYCSQLYFHPYKHGFLQGYQWYPIDLKYQIPTFIERMLRKIKVQSNSIKLHIRLWTWKLTKVYDTYTFLNDPLCKCP